MITPWVWVKSRLCLTLKVNVKSQKKSLHLFLKIEPRVGLNSMSVRCERFFYVLVQSPCTFEVTKICLEVRSKVTMSHILITPCLEVLTQLSSLKKSKTQWNGMFVWCLLLWSVLLSAINHQCQIYKAHYSMQAVWSRCI